jgi:hypothetical protein
VLNRKAEPVSLFQNLYEVVICTKVELVPDKCTERIYSDKTRHVIRFVKKVTGHYKLYMITIQLMAQIVRVVFRSETYYFRPKK